MGPHLTEPLLTCWDSLAAAAASPVSMEATRVPSRTGLSCLGTDGPTLAAEEKGQYLSLWASWGPLLALAPQPLGLGPLSTMVTVWEATEGQCHWSFCGILAGRPSKLGVGEGTGKVGKALPSHPP